MSLNLATGYLGQLPLGHAGFMAVGAYASAIFMKSAAAFPLILSLPLGLIIGGIAAGIFGFIIGIPALRLKGDYLAIITLGFGEIIRVVLLNIDSVVGFSLTYGASGLKSIPKTTTFLDAFICVGIVCFIIHTMLKSRHGRAVLSIRENEIAAESCGINTTYYKTMAFVMSAFFAGIAGSLYAGYIGILDPSGFGFMKSIEILVMVVLGGMGSMIGSRHRGGGVDGAARVPARRLGLSHGRLFAAAGRCDDFQADRPHGDVRLFAGTPSGPAMDRLVHGRKAEEEGDR